MPSFQDSAILVLLALLLFGPKKLPELARQLGKLMAEFRRASNEFRMQMEDELRIADQQEQQKKIAEMQAAAPIAPAVTSPIAEAAIYPSEIPLATDTPVTPERISQLTQELIEDHQPVPSPAEPLPIATSGNLNLMPPSTGLPVSNATLSPVLDSIPHTSDSEPEPATAEIAATEASQRG
jgi:sec-independent protein translocase protein TatB